jgi:hypothetical protein
MREFVPDDGLLDQILAKGLALVGMTVCILNAYA